METQKHALGYDFRQLINWYIGKLRTDLRETKFGCIIPRHSMLKLISSRRYFVSNDLKQRSTATSKNKINKKQD